MAALCLRDRSGVVRRGCLLHAGVQVRVSDNMPGLGGLRDGRGGYCDGMGLLDNGWCCCCRCCSRRVLGLLGASFTRHDWGAVCTHNHDVRLLKVIEQGVQIGKLPMTACKVGTLWKEKER